MPATPGEAERGAKRHALRADLLISKAKYAGTSVQDTPVLSSHHCLKPNLPSKPFPAWLSTSSMLFSKTVSGSIQCALDTASCVLDGQSSRRVINVKGTGGQTLSFRGLTFKDGKTDYGGGLYINTGAIVNILLCIFSSCRATTGNGGGAIYLGNNGATVNVFGSRFTGNTADSGDGKDVFNNGGTMIFHSSCPSPYSSNTPTQGKLERACVEQSDSIPSNYN